MSETPPASPDSSHEASVAPSVEPLRPPPLDLTGDPPDALHAEYDIDYDAQPPEQLPAALDAVGPLSLPEEVAAAWTESHAQDASTLNRRQAPRLDFLAPAVLSFDGYAETFEVSIVNLSASGLACRGPKGLSVADRVRLRFCFQATEPARTFLSEVRWVRDDLADTATYGLGFVALPVPTQEALNSVLETWREGPAQAPGLQSPPPGERNDADPDYRAFLTEEPAEVADSSPSPSFPAALPLPGPSRSRWPLLLNLLVGAAVGSASTAALLLVWMPSLAPVPPAFPAIKAATPTLADLAQLHADTAMREAERRSAAKAHPAVSEPPEPVAEENSARPPDAAEPAAAQDHPPAAAEPLAAAELPPAPAAVAAAPSPLPAGLRLEEAAGRLDLFVELDGPAAHKDSFWLSRPTRLVVDITQRRSRLKGKTVELSGPLASRLRVGEHPTKTRLVLETRGSRPPQVSSRFEGHVLRLTLRP